jgi:GMP synthase-like glutamine amidotransferase
VRIVALNHVPFENPGYIRNWAAAQGHHLEETRLHAQDPLPTPADFDWLVVMGGPMSVGDEARHPWLKPERQLIGEAIVQDKVVIGICLGAQLIARVLGADVVSMPHKEVGWFPVTPTAQADASPLVCDLPSSLDLFHWHGDMFQLPRGAVHLAASEACAHQIFSLNNRVVGLQCHAEMTPAGVAALADNCAGDIASGRWAQTREQLTLDDGRFERAHAWMEQLLKNIETNWKADQEKSTQARK